MCSSNRACRWWSSRNTAPKRSAIAHCIGRADRGFRCLVCNERRRCRFHRGLQVYYQHRVYRHQTTLLSGAIFQATKLPLHTWMLALHLLTATKTNMATPELMRHLGVNYKAAWRIK
ncbi:hypothetical protein HDE78_001880 [Rhodanobacter sp. K2T2]|nr:hypothetical protein [Rhodanobacter sp. K2T2]